MWLEAREIYGYVAQNWGPDSFQLPGPNGVAFASMVSLGKDYLSLEMVKPSKLSPVKT